MMVIISAPINKFVVGHGAWGICLVMGRGGAAITVVVWLLHQLARRPLQCGDIVPFTSCDGPIMMQLGSWQMQAVNGPKQAVAHIWLHQPQLFFACRATPRPAMHGPLANTNPALHEATKQRPGAGRRRSPRHVGMRSVQGHATCIQRLSERNANYIYLWCHINVGEYLYSL